MINELADDGIIEDALETIDLCSMLLSVLNKLMFVLGVIPSLPRFRIAIGVSTSLCPWKLYTGFESGYG